MPWSTYGSLLFANAFIWTSTAASALSSSVGLCSGSSGSGLDEEDGEQAARGAPRGRHTDWVQHPLPAQGTAEGRRPESSRELALGAGVGPLRAARAGPTIHTGALRVPCPPPPRWPLVPHTLDRVLAFVVFPSSRSRRRKRPAGRPTRCLGGRRSWPIPVCGNPAPRGRRSLGDAPGPQTGSTGCGAGVRSGPARPRRGGPGRAPAAASLGPAEPAFRSGGGARRGRPGRRRARARGATTRTWWWWGRGSAGCAAGRCWPSTDSRSRCVSLVGPPRV